VHAIKGGTKSMCAVFGPTCDALDVVSMSEQLPDLQRGDLVYSVNIGAYSHASATYFNGFPPAMVVHNTRLFFAPLMLNLYYRRCRAAARGHLPGKVGASADPTVQIHRSCLGCAQLR
jgi:hypothetical protein